MEKGMNENKSVTAYKMFDKDFKCRDFQYEEGKTYTHDGDVNVCESGFHACINPFDCWSYYDITDSRFAEVEADRLKDSKNDDSKIAAAEITIKAELHIAEFVKRCVKWLISNTVLKKDNEIASGDYSQLAASGYSSVIASSSNDGRAKGVAGTWLSLASFNDEGKCQGFATGCVGKDGLKPDVWYKTNDNCEFVEIT